MLTYVTMIVVERDEKVKVMKRKKEEDKEAKKDEKQNRSNCVYRKYYIKVFARQQEEKLENREERKVNEGKRRGTMIREQNNSGILRRTFV